MFGWLKRRLVTQHRKLAYQTFKAATDPEMPFLCSAKGGIDAKPIFEQARNIATELILVTSKGDAPTTDLVSSAFDANKDMRRCFDGFGRKDRGSFDQIYQPLMGWAAYFDNHTNELHLLDSQREVHDQMNKLRDETERD